jgi:small subunit ribosomal protein S9
MMADEENPETPDTPEAPASGAQSPAEGEAGHAVPTEDAAEIAGSAEDAALEAFEESQEHPKAEPAGEPEQFDPIAGNAVPSADATEIAGSVEDAPLEAAQEAEERAEAEVLADEFEEVVAEGIAAEVVQEAVVEEIEVEAEIEAVAEVLAEEIVAEAVEAEIAEVAQAEVVEEAVAEEAVAEAEAELEEELEEEPAPRVKPSVPGAHLEVDIVPEGVDPLGRDQGYVDPYAIDEDTEPQGEGDERDEEEVLSEPISTAAIDLASGARYRATGKRKTAIARVTLRPGSGSYLVNGRTLEEHFPRITLQRNIRQPLETVGYQERMDVVARLHGGGISAQAGALRHGVSRALLEADPNLRGELKRRGFLTRDARVKERKKAGLKKARKRPQFSKR